jgi:flagellar basal body-associated protein FliL
MLINKSQTRSQERSEKAKENRRIPIYILILIGLFLLAIVIYMLSSWLN